MTDEIKLSSGLQLFKPRSRHAVLLNSYDIFFDEYLQTNMYSRGNMRVYELEAILREEFGKGPGQFEPTLSKLLQLEWGQLLVSQQKYRQGIIYDSASRVLPKTDMIGELDRNIERISGVSSDDTLTFMYITSHGKIGSLVINNGQEMSYQDLLDRIDEIKGKKVITALACYSGSLVDAWREREKKADYIILTSTNNGEEGINHCEDELHNRLVKSLLAKQRLSDLRIPSVMRGEVRGVIYEHHPQIVGSYDVIL